MQGGRAAQGRPHQERSVWLVHFIGHPAGPHGYHHPHPADAGDNYGYEINKTIQQRTGGQYGFKEATLYTAFRRLEQSGLITSYWGEDGPGARRRYYAITEAGRQRWDENRREWRDTRALLDALIDIEEE